MSAVDSGKVFIHDVPTWRFEHAKKSESHDIPDAVDFDNDASRFAADTINSVLVKDMCGHTKRRPEGQDKKLRRTSAIKRGARDISLSTESILGFLWANFNVTYI